MKLVLLLMLAATAVGDTTCTNGAVTGGAAGDAGTACNCDAGYSGGGDVNTGTYTDCAACGTGEYQPQTGQTACVACAAGKYRDTTVAASSAETTACKDCGAGEYTDAAGLKVCKGDPCVTGSSYVQVAQQTVVTCAACGTDECQPQSGQTIIVVLRNRLCSVICVVMKSFYLMVLLRVFIWIIFVT